MANCIMGLDIGPSGCKAVVFDTAGRERASARREYALEFPKDGWMELNAETVAKAAFDCVKHCALSCGTIEALAVSSQGEAIIPVDAEGKPLLNAVVTFDNRCAEETAWLTSEFGRDFISDITGAPIHTMFSLPKILWIKNKVPDIYKKTWKFLCFGDFISMRLGAAPVIDFSMASRTLAFDIRKKTWSEPILNRCGIPLEKMPETAVPGTAIGTITAQTASLTGLRPGTKIIAGGHDQVCCALGSGVLTGGTAMDSLGTTESILCVGKTPRTTQAMREKNIPCYCYTVNGLYAYLTFLSSSGAILKWFTEDICRNTDMTEMDKEAEVLPTGSMGLSVLPHFAGSGTPYLDFDSKGIIAGLSLGTTRQQIYRAILEATCFESRLNIENMEKSGIEVHELICVGGGAKSDFWLQMKADITEKPVVRSLAAEAGCFGAAILAGIGAGIYRSAGDAFSAAKGNERRFFPDEKRRKLYNEVYRKYEKLYGLSLEYRKDLLT